MNNSFVCQSQRLIFGKITHDDIDILQELYGNEEVMKYVTGTVRRRDETALRVQKNTLHYEEHGFGLYTVYCKKTGTFLGRCGIEPVMRDGRVDGELTWMFHPKYWGKGYGTEAALCLVDFAFRKLKLEFLVAMTDKNNHHSIKIIEKLQMHLIHETNGKRVYQLSRRKNNVNCSYRVAKNSDMDSCKQLLEQHNLPTKDFELSKLACVIAEIENEIIGVAALEVHEEYGLFRSFAVDKKFQGKGIGSTLFNTIKNYGVKKKVKEFYLLTEGADSYFLIQGFRKISRYDVPEVMLQTDEFSSICPDSASVFVLSIKS